jgi:hypothetical protein
MRKSKGDADEEFVSAMKMVDASLPVNDLRKGHGNQKSVWSTYGFKMWSKKS